jgi:hypothetical protein
MFSPLFAFTYDYRLGLLMLGLPLLVLLPFPVDLIRAIQEQATFM